MKMLKYILLIMLINSSIEANAKLRGSAKHRLSTKINELVPGIFPDEHSHAAKHFTLTFKSGEQIKHLTAAQVMEVIAPIKKEREAARRQAEEAARLGTAAKRIQEGAREHLAYKAKQAEYAEIEKRRQAEIMAASGLFSENEDETRLGSIRSTARHIMGSIERYMEEVGVLLCREAYQAIEKGEVEASEMPLHVTVYEQILSKAVPADRPWVRLKDSVMEQDEKTIKATIKEVDAIIEAYIDEDSIDEAPDARPMHTGIRIRAGLSLDQSLSDPFEVFN